MIAHLKTIGTIIGIIGYDLLTLWGIAHQAWWALIPLYITGILAIVAASVVLYISLLESYQGK